MHYSTITRSAVDYRAIVWHEDQSAEFPYKRILGEFLIRGSDYQVFAIGDTVTICGENAVIIGSCPDVIACQSTFRFVILDTIARSPWGYAKSIKLTRPQQTVGESASVTDADQATGVPSVFQDGSDNEITIGGAVKLSIGQKAVYIQRATAVSVRSNWHVVDEGDLTKRYKVSRVVDLDKPDRLPALICELSQAPNA